MRICTRKLRGKREVISFTSWHKLCDWLKWNFPLKQAERETRDTADAIWCALSGDKRQIEKL